MQPTPEESKESFSEGYQKAYEKLLSEGMNPRKARRYLDSIAKRNLKKVIKKMKKSGRTGTVSTENLEETTI